MAVSSNSPLQEAAWDDAFKPDRTISPLLLFLNFVMLGLVARMWAFSNCSEQGLSPLHSATGFWFAVASLILEPGL